MANGIPEEKVQQELFEITDKGREALERQKSIRASRAAGDRSTSSVDLGRKRPRASGSASPKAS